MTSRGVGTTETWVILLIVVMIAGFVMAWAWRKKERQNPIHFGRSTDEDHREPLRS